MGARSRLCCTLRRLRLNLALAALLSEFHGIVQRLPGMPVGWCATAADAGWPESWPTSPLPLPCPPCPRASHLGGHCLSSSSQRSCPLPTAAQLPATLPMTRSEPHPPRNPHSNPHTLPPPAAAARHRRAGAPPAAGGAAAEQPLDAARLPRAGQPPDSRVPAAATHPVTAIYQGLGRPALTTQTTNHKLATRACGDSRRRLAKQCCRRLLPRVHAHQVYSHVQQSTWHNCPKCNCKQQWRGEEERRQEKEGTAAVVARVQTKPVGWLQGKRQALWVAALVVGGRC